LLIVRQGRRRFAHLDIDLRRFNNDWRWGSDANLCDAASER